MGAEFGWTALGTRENKNKRLNLKGRFEVHGLRSGASVA